MTVIAGVACGLLVLGLIFQFIISLRGQTLADKQIDKVVEVNTRILEHLACAANPEAWLAEQGEKHYQEQKEAVRNAPEPSDPEGVF